MRIARRAGVILCVFAFAPLAAAETVEEPTCFDALVSARVIEQIPSDAADNCQNCVVMEWPWFVDLKIERVLKGHISSRRLSVLAMLHTYIAPRPLTWGLRRNKAGGFNAQFDADKQTTLCKSTAGATEPYLRPKEGQTLEDLRQAGMQKYGKRP